MSQLSPLSDLVEEARRQLTVCNACRYCEGYCAVWPALERRHELTDGDLDHLANLCHDCRDCLDACMYAAPHPFELNPPKVFSELRLAGYERGRRGLASPQRRRRTALALVAAAIILVIIAGVDKGFGAISGSHHSAASPYAVISYVVLLIAMAVPATWSVGEMAVAAVRHWRHTATPLRAHGARAAIVAGVRALPDAAVLRNLDGGGAGCTYPTEKPSRIRKVFHHLVAYGFGLCSASTVSAAVLQDFVGQQPPYPFMSVPVLLGTVGGIAMAVGCAGLMWLKTAARRGAIDPDMATRDVSFIAALGGLAVTGLLVLLLRSSRLFGLILIVHLAIVAVCFAVAPYSKFVHWIPRYLALVQDRLEAV